VTRMSVAAVDQPRLGDAFGEAFVAAGVRE
jgi:hypothetical protein